MFYEKAKVRLRIFLVIIWKILMNTLAYFPILFFVSILGIVIPAALLSLLISKDTVLLILEISIFLFLIGFYFKYLSKNNLLKIVFFAYWIISIVSLIMFLFTKLKFLILFQFALTLICIFHFTTWLKKIKEFLTESTEVLAFMNMWDTIFCGILIFILYHLDQVESILSYFMKRHKISGAQMSNWISILLIIILPFIYSFIKTIVSIKIFKNVNKIYITKGKTLWNVHATMFIASFLWLFIYLYYFISRVLRFKPNLILDIFIFFFFIVSYLICWRVFYNQIKYGAKDIKEVVASWLTGTICILVLATFNQVENELISALTWFLPILIPSLIGKIDSQFDTKRYKKKPIRTEKMDRHLYRIQLYGFLTLLMLSIIPKLIEIISGLSIKLELAKFINPSADWMAEFLASTLIILFCFMLSLVVGGVIIWLLKYFYLDKYNRYYEFRNITPNVLNNHKYRKNIHKRRKNNV